MSKYIERDGIIVGINKLQNEQGDYGSLIIKLNDKTYISAYMNYEQKTLYSGLRSIFGNKVIVIRNIKSKKWYLHTVER